MGPKPAQVPGVGKQPKSGRSEGIKQALLFFFFDILPCYVGEEWICSIALVLSVQLPDSDITYPWCISFAFLNFFFTIEGQEECQASGLCEL